MNELAYNNLISVVNVALAFSSFLLAIKLKLWKYSKIAMAFIDTIFIIVILDIVMRNTIYNYIWVNIHLTLVVLAQFTAITLIILHLIKSHKKGRRRDD
jgi:asparagine N-glycosylation enzyme membrane subunit Stt3